MPMPCSVLHLRDLLVLRTNVTMPSSTADSNLLPYILESGQPGDRHAARHALANAHAASVLLHAAGTAPGAAGGPAGHSMLALKNTAEKAMSGSGVFPGSEINLHAGDEEEDGMDDLTKRARMHTVWAAHMHGTSRKVHVPQPEPMEAHWLWPVTLSSEGKE